MTMHQFASYAEGAAFLANAGFKLKFEHIIFPTAMSDCNYPTYRFGNQPFTSPVPVGYLWEDGVMMLPFHTLKVQPGIAPYQDKIIELLKAEKKIH